MVACQFPGLIGRLTDLKIAEGEGGYVDGWRKCVHFESKRRYFCLPDTNEGRKSAGLASIYRPSAT